MRPFSSWQGGMEAAWRQGGRGRGRARLGDGLSNRAGAAARPPAPVGRGGACVQMAASGGEGTCGECPSPPQPSGGARQPGLASEGRPQNGTGASGRARRTRVAVGPASAPLPAGASRGSAGASRVPSPLPGALCVRSVLELSRGVLSQRPSSSGVNLGKGCGVVSSC